MKAIGCTHPGPRKHNEDSHGILELDDALLLIVADGLGGHNAGEVASNLAVKEIQGSIKKHYGSTDDHKKILAKAIGKANREIFDLAAANPGYSGMGTTVVAVLVKGNKAVAVNVGDSRAYLISDNGIRQITKDHSLVQSLLDMDAIDEEEALGHPQKNVVLRSLGTKETVDGDFIEVGLNDGELLMLCTDGITDTLTDSQISGIIQKDDGLEVIARKLVEACLKGETKDNITVVLYKFSKQFKP
jgi:serine/threonine protein phosphatase PrpC